MDILWLHQLSSRVSVYTKAARDQEQISKMINSPSTPPPLLAACRPPGFFLQRLRLWVDDAVRLQCMWVCNLLDAAIAPVA
jgi:hypothetical protein